MISKHGILKNYQNKMAKARKEGKPKRNRANLVKRLAIIKHNEELLKQYNQNNN